MTARPITPADWYPVHCAVCLQAGRKTAATWIVNGGQGTRGYLACEAHRADVEIRGPAAIRPGGKGQPL